MANYYEMLKVVPTATSVEIDAAIESQYNQWRRLVTHHDPNSVNQANQSLQTLETIRSVLTDPGKRSIYDAGVGIGSAVGGLADPEAVLNMASSLPPTPPVPHRGMQGQGTTSHIIDAWTCPKCQTANPIKTRFCKTCGTALGRECPNCNQLIEMAAPFCPECGADVKAAERAKRAREEEAAHIRALQEQHSAAQRQVAEREAHLVEIKRGAQLAWRLVKWGYVLAFTVIGFTLGGAAWFLALIIAWRVLRLPPVSGDDTYRAQAQKAYNWAKLSMIVEVGLFTIVAIISTLIRR